MLPKICKVDPDRIQLWEVAPVCSQSSITTGAPLVGDPAVRHFRELAMGWMYWFEMGAAAALVARISGIGLPQTPDAINRVNNAILIDMMR